MKTMMTNGQPEESLKEALHRWASKSELTFKRQAELLNIRESTFANSLNPHIEDCHYHLRQVKAANRWLKLLALPLKLYPNGINKPFLLRNVTSISGDPGQYS